MKKNEPTMRMTEVAYQEWAGETIARLTAINAELLEACKIAQRWLKRSGFGGNGALVALNEAICNAEEQVPTSVVANDGAE